MFACTPNPPLVSIGTDDIRCFSLEQMAEGCRSTHWARRQAQRRGGRRGCALVAVLGVFDELFEEGGGEGLGCARLARAVQQPVVLGAHRRVGAGDALLALPPPLAHRCCHISSIFKALRRSCVCVQCPLAGRMDTDCDDLCACYVGPRVRIIEFCETSNSTNQQGRTRPARR